MDSTEKTERRKTQVKALESIFRAKYNICFPRAYREFLIERGTAKIAGYPILGIPKQEGIEKTEEETKEREERKKKEGSVSDFSPTTQNFP
jgi:hypothetical protein